MYMHCTASWPKVLRKTNHFPTELFTSMARTLMAEIFISKKQQNFTWYGRRNDTFVANRPSTGVSFIRCLYRVTGVSIGQGEDSSKTFELGTGN